MNIISRKKAKDQGLKRYFTGKPCKHDHINERQTINGTCIECSNSKLRVYYQNNKAIIKEKSRTWKRKNKDRVNELSRINYAKDSSPFKERTKKYIQRNPDKNKERHRIYSQDNRANCNSRRVAYRARKLERTPIWFTNDFRHAIQALFEYCHLLSDNTGTKHHVDHDIPLQGKLVSGLHVPDNLMIMVGIDNQSKSNKWNPMNEIIMHKNDDGTYWQEVVL